MTEKNIWFINQYITSPEMCGESHRHFSLAKYLVANNNVTLFTGSFSHLHENKSSEEVVEEDGIKIVNLKVLKYRNTLTRILNFFHFVLRLRFFNYRQLSEPDIIVISTMSLFPLLLIPFYRKNFKNVKIVHEIRDIWPLTPIMLGGYSPKHPFIKLLAYCEYFGYENADYFVANLEFADRHIAKVVNKKDIPFTWISNGVDAQENIVDLPESITRKIPKNKFLIGYAGTIGNANAMEVVIDAFNKLESADICLCIAGDGVKKKALMNKSKNNLIFLGQIPKNQVCSFLKKMDACILSWKKIELYQYGISPNKIFDYMNAAKPIIMCGDMKSSVVEQANCGWISAAEDSEKLAELLLKISKLTKEELELFGRRGKEYLDANFKYSYLAERYQKEVFDNV